MGLLGILDLSIILLLILSPERLVYMCVVTLDGYLAFYLAILRGVWPQQCFIRNHDNNFYPFQNKNTETN